MDSSTLVSTYLSSQMSINILMAIYRHELSFFSSCIAYYIHNIWQRAISYGSPALQTSADVLVKLPEFSLSVRIVCARAPSFNKAIFRMAMLDLGELLVSLAPIGLIPPCQSHIRAILQAIRECLLLCFHYTCFGSAQNFFDPFLPLLLPLYNPRVPYRPSLCSKLAVDSRVLVKQSSMVFDPMNGFPGRFLLALTISCDSV
ncbi:hypothetical protein ABKN59_008297 [Abortiporus biennis]